MQQSWDDMAATSVPAVSMSIAFHPKGRHSVAAWLQFQLNEQLATVNYNLDRWRATKCTLPASDLDILDANG